MIRTTYSIDQETIPFSTPSRSIDFGEFSTARIYMINDKPYLLEVHTNGPCNCGAVLNNGQINKCDIAERYPMFANVDFLMHYNWGSLDHFFNRIEDGVYISGCDKNIIHAKIYNGEYPNAILINDSKNVGSLQALVVNKHVDYKVIPSETKFMCGATSPVETTSYVDSSIFDVVNTDILSILSKF